MKIVIAEDDFTSRSILDLLQARRGHDVVTKVNGVGTREARHETDESA